MIDLLDIVHRPVKYWKHNVSETGSVSILWCEVECTCFVGSERASLCVPCLTPEDRNRSSFWNAVFLRNGPWTKSKKLT